MVFLVESGFAQQTDVARAFARSVRTVRRYQGRYARGGMAALGGRRGLASRPTTGLRETSAQHRDAQDPGDEQPGDRTPAGRQREGHPQAGRTVGPPEAHRERTACVCRDHGRGDGEAAGVCEVDRGWCGSRHAIGRGPRRRPREIPAPADDGEPVPMSLDRDASDRTFDRQLVYLGCSMMPHRCFARGPRFPVSASYALYRAWSRAGCFGSAASSTVKSVRRSMACVRR
jgi:hypothetical protein